MVQEVASRVTLESKWVPVSAFSSARRGGSLPALVSAAAFTRRVEGCNLEDALTLPGSFAESSRLPLASGASPLNVKTARLSRKQRPDRRLENDLRTVLQFP